jgi:sulfopyruvate decarboxylase subunit beta
MMKLREAMEILAAHRGQRIVVATMSSDTGLDFIYVPSAMGQGPPLGHGLALAQPERGVIVINGDGCTLMNLGCLVTLANHPANVYLLIVDNGLYEVTGGQPTAGTGHTDFAALARASGITRVYSYDNANAWRADAPVVIWLKVEGRLDQPSPKAPRPMAEQIRRLRSAL